MSIALGEKVQDWSRQVRFSIKTDPLEITSDIKEEEEPEVVTLDKLYNPAEIFPYGLMNHQENGNLTFHRLFLENGQLSRPKNWLLMVPIKTDFSQLNIQAKQDDWAGIHKTLPISLEMLEGDQLSKINLD